MAGASDSLDSTRNRILAAAMRLFGEQGYVGTTVAQIEDAAGLSRGAGGLYRHFASKHELLEAGIAHAIEAESDLAGMLIESATMSSLPLEERLLLIARAGLRRLEHDRDVNRLVLRDLARFPELLAKVRDDEILRTFTTFALWLRSQPETESRRDVDWDSTAAVLVASMFHYWLLRDTFGAHPTGIDEDRYLQATVALVLARTAGDPP